MGKNLKLLKIWSINLNMYIDANMCHIEPECYYANMYLHKTLFPLFFKKYH